MIYPVISLGIWCGHEMAKAFDEGAWV